MFHVKKVKTFNNYNNKFKKNLKDGNYFIFFQYLIIAEEF